MAERIARWTCYGLGLGLLPLLVAYVVRAYYLARAPSAVDVLAGGDALLVVAAWAATALVECAAASQRASRGVVATASALLLTGSVVAYACLTADSVTGRVQTGAQRRWITSVSLVGLPAGALVSTGAVALPRPSRREEER